MAEIVITPTGTDALEVGAFIDNDGRRFVGLSFKMDNGDYTVVTLTVPLFNAYSEHLAKASAQFASEDYWRTVPR
ncbi:hypothetical protein K3M67_03115 [Sphingobium sp. V4]|uniref:hypothetical protein n=1 Tax=Sphingobium sp. V4 TaxID=3038927 RepID=UPI0025583288|nr:hypothetical protein [Sphingobium sp. V4]WIW88987.1 hypothetical protein K3M67_03115 [Sphingobium sp. V4]